MKLTIFRHAKAQSHQISSDYDRRLVDNGVKQVRRAGAFALRHDLVPDLVLTSPLVRAQQSADLFCAEVRIHQPVTCSWLAAGAAPDDIVSELSAYTEFPHVMVVGHNPDFEWLVAFLLGGDGGAISVKKASLITINIRSFRRGGGFLCSSVPPSMMDGD